jgi:hypothetical protein
MFAEHDGDISNGRYIAPYTAHDIFLAVEVVLASSIELGVVSNIVIALGEKPLRRLQGDR